MADIKNKINENLNDIITLLTRKLSNVYNGINKLKANVKLDILPKNMLDTHILIDPNFLLDILVKFILVASFIYILYKYFLIDMTINYSLDQIRSHISIYETEFKAFIKTLIDQQELINYLNTQSDKLSNQPSTKDSKANDTNFAIILATCLIVSTILVFVILLITGGYKTINYDTLIYNIVLNIVILVVSQLVFFYLVYSYFDPVKLYKFFYYNYIITKQPPAPTTTTPTTTKSPFGTKNPAFTLATTTTIFGSTTTTASQVPITPRETIIKTSNDASIYIFLVIFVLLFIIFSIITVLNILIVHYNYSLPNSIIPMNGLTVYIYGILACICMFLFIIMTLVITNRIKN